MKVVIIVPTYNERENIGRLIEALEGQFATIRHDMHILVVDDTSPDGTAEVVRGLMSTRVNLHLLIGRKEGLGAAYIRGMDHALRDLGADAVFEMDADFSHKPEDVPRLLAALDGGADFVIGSRYVQGGSIPAEWGTVRRMNSQVRKLRRPVCGGNLSGPGLHCRLSCHQGIAAAEDQPSKPARAGVRLPGGLVV